MAASEEQGARSSAAVTLIVALAGTAVITLGFWWAWHPRAFFYVYNVPIAAPFVAFLLERLGRPASRPRSALALDVAVVCLALLRVVAPPLPYASGHTLFTAYAAATARRWPLRVLAAAVLVQVAYLKLFVTGGGASLLAGLGLAAAAALVAARLRRR
jgi:hypothetical protein